MSALLDSLTKAGTKPLSLQDKVVILPFGGRIIGLFPQPNINTLYVQPELMDPNAIPSLLKSAGWIALGGDRTWVSPELDVIGDYENDVEHYAVPKELDPGKYSVKNVSHDAATLESPMTLPFRRANTKLDFTLTKTIRLMDPPSLPKGVAYAGFSLDVALKPASPLPKGVTPAIWELLQVPGGGKITAPVRPKTQPRTLINKPIYATDNDCITSDVPTTTAFKYSVRANGCLGMCAYINVSSDPATLIVRTFDVFENDRYRDVTAKDPTGYGNVLEVYVDDGRFGGFGEMEHQSPAMGLDGSKQVTDHSETMAFAGKAEALEKLLKDMIAKRRQAR